MSSADDFSRILPSYLTDSTRKAIKAALKSFWESNRVLNDPFSYNNNDFFLQGDILKNVPFPTWIGESFFTVPTANCIILSNTCDMDVENTRVSPINCVLAPIFSIEKYQQKLRDNHQSEKKINDFYENLISYQLSHLFYLPIDEEFNYSREGKGYFVALDRAFSLPRYVLDLNQHVKSLNQFGSYLFTFQISVNLCRFHDKVDRDAGICF